MEANAVHNTLAAALALLLVARTLWHLVWRPYTVARWFERQGIRGPPYGLVVGSLPEMRRMLVAGRAEAPLDPGCHDYTALAMPFFRKWASDYGRTFLYWLGPLPALCSTDMELLKQVLDDRTDLFHKDYLNLNPRLGNIFGRGLITTNGDYRRRHRKVIYPIFNKESLKSVSAMTYEGTQDMIEQWCSQIEKGGGQRAEIDMKCYAEDLTLEVIGQVIFGKDDRKVAQELFVVDKELQKLAVYAFSDPPIAAYRYLPTRRNFRSWKLDKLMTSTISQLINKRIAGCVYGEDLLGLMLKAHTSKLEKLSTREIIDECKTFFAAGYDSCANLLTWGMFLLCTYPEWQDKLRGEVLREYQDCRETPSMDVLGKLKLLNIFLLETLRLYSPVPFLARKTASDTTLAGIKVPKGTMITFPIVMLHRSNDVWGLDADELNPMRFEKGILRATKHAHALLAFSYGPRVCAGQNYAMIEVLTIMATILRRFSFSLSSSRYVHMPTSFLTVVPRYGLPLIVRNLQDGENK